MNNNLDITDITSGVNQTSNITFVYSFIFFQFLIILNYENNKYSD